MNETKTGLFFISDYKTVTCKPQRYSSYWILKELDKNKTLINKIFVAIFKTLSPVSNQATKFFVKIEDFKDIGSYTNTVR